MADRYWVGGTASWDGTAGTKWSATSGGAGGASVPTTADAVFFNASSTGTVTIAAFNLGAQSINCAGFTGTITGTAAISVAGSVTLVAGMTYTHTGTATFTGTGTLTTAGKEFSGVRVNAAGITLTLGDALNISTRQLDVNFGAFNTANYAITAGSFASSGSSSRTVNLGSSAITLSNTTPFVLTTTSNLTFNAGTSSITCTGNNGTASGGNNLTFYNLSFTSGLDIFNMPITSCNNLSISKSATFRTRFLTNTTVTGTFTCAGSAPQNRATISSNSASVTATITAGALSADDCDFKDITIAGAAAGTAPVRAGNAGGNSGIVFPASKTVYRVGTNTTWNGSDSWATSSGGIGSNINVPLPQDTAIIDDNSGNVGGTIVANINGQNFSTIDCTARTSALTLSLSSAYYCGSLKLGSGITWSNAGSSTFFTPLANSELLTAGKTINSASLIIESASNSTLTLLDALLSSSGLFLNKGGFNANGYNVTINRFSSSSGSRSLSMGSGLWTLTGTIGGPEWALSGAITFDKGTANILFTGSGSDLFAFNGGGFSYNKFTFADTATNAFVFGGTTTDNNTSFSEIASIRSAPFTIRLGANLGSPNNSSCLSLHD